jgi:hypothetical protein
MEQEVLNCLFKIDKKPEKLTNDHGYMDWRKIVMELHDDYYSGLHSSAMPATRQKPQHGIILQGMYVSFKYILLHCASHISYY